MEDAKLEALVLSVDTSTKTANCYSLHLESRILVKLPENIRVTKGSILVLTDTEINGDIWIPTEESFKTRKAEQVRFHAGEMLVETIAACSENEKHGTFDMNRAYAGAYGFVAVSDAPRPRGIAFIVDLAINKDTSPGAPIFRIVRVKQQLTGQANREFIKKMKAVEDKLPAPEEWEQWPENLDDQLSVASTTSQVAAVPDNGGTERNFPTGISSNVEQIEAARCNDFPDRRVESDIDSLNHTAPSKIKNSFPGDTIMQAVLKVESELCCVVLNVGDDCIVGWETTQLRLVRIALFYSYQHIIEKYKTMKFIVEGVENGMVNVKDGSMSVFDIDRPTNDDGEKENLLVTRVAFASNKNFASHNFSVAVSDKYGHVHMPRGSGQYEHSTVYTAKIAIIQHQDPRAPIFEVYGDLQRMDGEAALDDSFSEAIRKYEGDFFSDMRQNGLGSTLQSPKKTPSTLPSQATFKKFESEGNTEIKALVISVAKRVERGCYGMVWTKFGDVMIRCGLVAQNGDEVRLGDWVSVRMEIVKNKNGVKNLRKVSTILRIENLDLKMTLLHGQPVLTGNLSFRLKKGQDNDVHYYSRPHLGIVQVPHYIYGGQSESSTVIVEFHRTDDEIEVSGTKVFWVAEKIVPASESKQSFSQPAPMQGHGWASTPEKESIRPSFETQNYEPTYQGNMPSTSSTGFNMPSMLYNQSGPSTRTQSHVGTSEYAYSRPQNYSVPPSQSYPLSTPAPTMPNTQNKYFAIAVVRKGHKLIVDLPELKAAAVMNIREVQGPTVRLGNAFYCEYKLLEAPYDTILYEITKVLELTNYETKCKISGDECLIKVSVNLSQYDEEMNRNNAMYGQNLVVMADFGNIVLAELIADPQKKQQRAVDIIETYKAKKESLDMVGFCRYSKILHPIRMFDESDTSKESVTGYVWELIELVGTFAADSVQQERLDERNLGDAAPRLKEEDDISRQKRLNKENEKAQSMPYGQSVNGNRSTYAASSVGAPTTAQSFYAPADYSRPQSTYMSAASNIHDGPGTRAPSGMSGAPSNIHNVNPSSSSTYGQQPPYSNMNIHFDAARMLERSVLGHKHMTEAIKELLQRINTPARDASIATLISISQSNDEIVSQYEYYRQQGSSEGPSSNYHP